MLSKLLTNVANDDDTLLNSISVAYMLPKLLIVLANDADTAVNEPDISEAICVEPDNNVGLLVIS